MNFGRTCSLLLLLSSCYLASPVFAGPPTPASEPTIKQLQEENASLRRQLMRLQSQVAAQREELNSPGASQIISGLGYIVGIFGLAGWLAGRKKSAQENS